MSNVRSFSLIFVTVLFTVVGQLFLKKGAVQLGALPVNKVELPIFFIKSVFKPYIFMGLFCAVIAAISWIGTLSKLKLSYAYPLLSISYVLVMIFSFVVFKEKIQAIQWIGAIVICFGVFLISRV